MIGARTVARLSGGASTTSSRPSIVSVPRLQRAHLRRRKGRARIRHHRPHGRAAPHGDARRSAAACPTGEAHLALTRDVTARRDAEEALASPTVARTIHRHARRTSSQPARAAAQRAHLLRHDARRRRARQVLDEMMERQLNHLVRLVDDLLEMSRISRGAHRAAARARGAGGLVRTPWRRATRDPRAG